MPGAAFPNPGSAFSQDRDGGGRGNSGKVPALVGPSAWKKFAPGTEAAWMPVQSLSRAVPEPALAGVPQTLSQVAAAIATRPAAELAVNIEKQVAGFQLKVAFTTDHEPLGLLGASGSGQKYDPAVHRRVRNPQRGENRAEWSGAV